MNIKPEQLKALAEMVGYAAITYNRGDDFKSPETTVINPEPDKFVEYSPLTNDSQAMELMEKLLKSHYWKLKYQADGFYFVNDNLHLAYTGKTINEAVTLAAIAMEEGDE